MKPRVLVICGDAWHSGGIVRRGLSAGCGRDFHFDFLDNPLNWPAEMPPTFAALVLAKANMISPADSRPWLTAEAEAGFCEYLKRGRGLLIVHGGISRYGELPLLRAAVGGTFVSHGSEGPVRLEPKASHKLAQGVETCTVRDEHYVVDFDGSEADVFLHSHSELGVQPAGWTRSVDFGRVCVLTPGHNLAVWLHPQFQILLGNALHWILETN